MLNTEEYEEEHWNAKMKKMRDVGDELLRDMGCVVGDRKRGVVVGCQPKEESFGGRESEMSEKVTMMRMHKLVLYLRIKSAIMLRLQTVRSTSVASRMNISQFLCFQYLRELKR